MKKLIKHKVFIGVFLSAYFLFFVITISVFDLKREAGFIIGHMEYGFPFAYYYGHCFGGYYLWFGLAGNILTATIISVVLGTATTHFWLRFSSPEFRAKWHI